jgi:hypothetical protein
MAQNSEPSARPRLLTCAVRFYRLPALLSQTAAVQRPRRASTAAAPAIINARRRREPRAPRVVCPSSRAFSALAVAPHRRLQPSSSRQTGATAVMSVCWSFADLPSAIIFVELPSEVRFVPTLLLSRHPGRAPPHARVPRPCSVRAAASLAVSRR